MNKMIAVLAIVLIGSNPGFAADGVITVKSNFTVKQTIERLEKVLQEKGMTLFTKIDHAVGAEKADLKLPPATVVLFGNPKVGTQLMQAAPTAALDLPQKALIWQDEKGQVMYSYNDPTYLVKRHAIKDREKVVTKITKVLDMLAQQATGVKQ